MLVPKLLLTPLKIRIFGPKLAKIGPKWLKMTIFSKLLDKFSRISALIPFNPSIYTYENIVLLQWHHGHRWTSARICIQNWSIFNCVNLNFKAYKNWILLQIIKHTLYKNMLLQQFLQVKQRKMSSFSVFLKLDNFFEKATLGNIDDFSANKIFREPKILA